MMEVFLCRIKTDIV